MKSITYIHNICYKIYNKYVDYLFLNINQIIYSNSIISFIYLQIYIYIYMCVCVCVIHIMYIYHLYIHLNVIICSYYSIYI